MEKILAFNFILVFSSICCAEITYSVDFKEAYDFMEAQDDDAKACMRKRL